jgi:hypothetical protein
VLTGKSYENASINVFNVLLETLIVNAYERKEQTNRNAAKIAALNEIFEAVIFDVSELIDGLYRGVKTHLIFGIIAILFGISEIAYNAEVIQERHYILLFIAGALLFAGATQILSYFRLRKKYLKLFKIEAELKKA